MELVNQILLSVLAYYSTRIETAGNLSTWIGVRCAVLCVCARACARAWLCAGDCVGRWFGLTQPHMDTRQLQPLAKRSKPSTYYYLFKLEPI